MNYGFQSLEAKISINAPMQFGLLGQLNGRPADQTAAHSASPTATSLSRRQEEVLRLLIQGYSNKEIARALDMGHGTVKVHVTALLHKLGVSSRTAAAVAGMKILAAKPSSPSSPGHMEIERSHPFGPSRFTV